MAGFAEYTEYDGLGLAALVRSGQVSAADVIEAAIARIEALNPALNAVITKLYDQARAAPQEQAPDAAFAGVPFLLKDLGAAQAGVRMTSGSRFFADAKAPVDAETVVRYRRAGLRILGRTNTPEFGLNASTEPAAFGPTRNPWDLARSAGGSSGGSAAAVAGGVVPVAYGSDTGGSIRQPAACCGVVGMKPTYGRVSRYGLVAFASSLDQIGPFARTAADAAVALAAVAGHDPRDSTSLDEPVPDWAGALDGDVTGLVVGLPREYFVEEGVDPEVLARVHAAVDVLQKAGAKVREVSLPHTRYAIATYYLIATAEASSNLARYDGVRYGRRAPADRLRDLYERSRSEGFGAEVKRRILLGTYVLSAGYYDAYYEKALRVRTLLRRDFEAAFATCDVLATPTTPEPAFRLGENTQDPLRMYLADVYTVAAPLAGIPGLSLPCGLAGGLPVGLQLLGKPLDEGALLRAADAYQRETEHHLARPPEEPA